MEHLPSASCRALTKGQRYNQIHTNPTSKHICECCHFLSGWKLDRKESGAWDFAREETQSRSCPSTSTFMYLGLRAVLLFVIEGHAISTSGRGPKACNPKTLITISIKPIRVLLCGEQMLAHLIWTSIWKMRKSKFLYFLCAAGDSTGWRQLSTISEQLIDRTITRSNWCCAPGTSEALRELMRPWPCLGEVMSGWICSVLLNLNLEPSRMGNSM